MLAIALAMGLAAQPEASRSVMLLPVEGSDVLPAVRAELDRALRASEAALVGGRFVSRDDTDAALEDAVRAGLRCSLSDVACAVQLGNVAGVTDLLIPTARALPSLELSLLHIDVERATGVAVGAAKGNDMADGEMAALLARTWRPPATLSVELVDIDGAGTITIDGVTYTTGASITPLAVSVASHSVGVIGSDGRVLGLRTVAVGSGHQNVRIERERQEIEPPAGPPTMAIVGGVVAGVGGLLGASGALLLVGAETQLSTPKDGPDPDVLFVQQLGVAGAVTAVLGAVGIVVGVAWISGASP